VLLDNLGHVTLLYLHSFQQATKAPHIFPYPNSETLTMATNELWNVNTLKIPSTIAAANDPNNPSPYPSLATILSDKHAELEATRVTKAAELEKFQSRHNELFKEVIAIKASLAKEQKALEKLTAQTKDLEASTKSEKKELVRINKRINTLVGKAAPI
jgi:hypothetical protein